MSPQGLARSPASAAPRAEAPATSSARAEGGGQRAVPRRRRHRSRRCPHRRAASVEAIQRRTFSSCCKANAIAFTTECDRPGFTNLSPSGPSSGCPSDPSILPPRASAWAGPRARFSARAPSLLARRGAARAPLAVQRPAPLATLAAHPFWELACSEANEEHPSLGEDHLRHARWAQPLLAPPGARRQHVWGT